MKAHYESRINKFVVLFPCCLFPLLSLLGIIGPAACVFSQPLQKKEVIALSAGAGVLTFHGDVGSNSLVGAYSFIRSGYSLSIEKYIHKSFSIGLNVLKGKIARDEKASDNLCKLNFESPIIQFGLNGTFLMAGKNERAVIPFISAGFSFLHFDPHGDLVDKNKNTYYYWQDGSIRDLPETGLTYFYAQTIDRDYKYETKLTDSAVNYQHTAFVLPLTAGVKMKLTALLDANLGFTYHMAFSDYLDNVKSSGPDAYLFSFASLTWHIFSLSKDEKEKFSNIDFTAIDEADTDKDGILDANDFCPGTPKEAKVDPKGCPIDGDGDGVPDYIDKELNSKTGSSVDMNGVTLTKARMTEIQKQNNNKASTRKDASSQQFNQKPSAEFMKQVEEMQKETRKNPENKTSNTAIPYDLRIADWNNDGFIAADEIAKTIDSFFDGTITFSAEQINRLIDFFFEQ